MNRKCIFAYLFVFIVMQCPITVSAGVNLVIKNQADFDDLQINLISLVAKGENEIDVSLVAGNYVFTEKHIMLKGLKNPRLKIKVKGGKDVVLMPFGREYKDGDLYYGSYNVNRSLMIDDKDIDIWSRVHYSEGLVEVVNPEMKLCRLKKQRIETASNDTLATYILIPCWYKASINKVTQIEDSYIYFISNNLSKNFNNKWYNINNDYNYGKCPIRYKLCNVDSDDSDFRIEDYRVQLKERNATVREGYAMNFMTIEDCEIASIVLEDLCICGNSYGKNMPLINLTKVKSSGIKISHCTFAGIRGDVIHVNESNNTSIKENVFHDCYGYGIKADNLSKKTDVEDNLFFNMDKEMRGSTCIYCCGQDYYIANNSMKDFGYGGIRVGVGYSKNKKQPCTGVVEYNEMTYTDAYVREIENHSLMDGGAIYLNTKNDKAVIRNNYIHNYVGRKDNRGIFCDDGSFNFEIYENIITGNLNCYSIDSRRVNYVEEPHTPNSGIIRANIKNKIYNNFVQAPIRFEGHEDIDNGCIKGVNYYLSTQNIAGLQKKYLNLAECSDDVTIIPRVISCNKVVLKRNDYNKMRKNRAWKFVRKYFKQSL